jgi:hypothetical protein
VLERNHEEYRKEKAETVKQKEEQTAQEQTTARKSAETNEFFALFKEENGKAWEEADGVPKEVIELQTKGKSLPDAYNAYLLTTYKSKIGATETNKKNAESSTGSVVGNDTKNTPLTDEVIEKMTDKERMNRWGEIKKHYGMK